MERVHGKLRDAIALREKLRTEARGGESKPRKTTLTFEQVALEWFEQIELRDRTREWYDVALRVHLLPRLGRRRVSSITAEDVERLIREMKRADRGEGKVGYAVWTIRGVVGVLGGVLGYAARRRLIVRDPMDDFRAEEKRRGRGRVLPKGASRQRCCRRRSLSGCSMRRGRCTGRCWRRRPSRGYGWGSFWR